MAVPFFYLVLKYERKFGRTRNSVGTKAIGDFFHSFLEFSQTFTSLSIKQLDHELKTCIP